MAMRPPPSRPEGLQDAVAGLTAGFDPSGAVWDAYAWTMALPWQARIAVLLAAGWLAVLAGLIAIRFAVLLAMHMVEGGLRFVGFASAQMMRALGRASEIAQGCAVYALWLITAPFAAALRGSRARLDRMAGAMRKPGQARAKAEPKAGGERAWALKILQLSEGFTPAEKKARLLELRLHLNSDQHKFLSDVHIQMVNQADLILRKRGSPS